MRKVLTSSQYTKKLWKNGQGTTQEILVWPEGTTEDFLWRISIADLKESGVFSLYPEYNRVIVIIEGDAVALDQSERNLEIPLLTPHAFDGAIQTYAHIRAPGRDFNLMLRKGVTRGKVTSAIGQKEYLIRSKFFGVFHLLDDSFVLYENELNKTISVDTPGNYLIVEIDS